MYNLKMFREFLKFNFDTDNPEKEFKKYILSAVLSIREPGVEISKKYSLVHLLFFI